jgi:hypothetical protein
MGIDSHLTCHSFGGRGLIFDGERRVFNWHGFIVAAKNNDIGEELDWGRFVMSRWG